MSDERICIVKKFSKPQPYQPIWQAMREHIDSKLEDDEIWFLQHQPVYTQGQAGKEEHILQHNQIPIVHTDRGGQVTYHGPGQLMVYTLVNLRKAGIGIRSMVSLLENSVIEFLQLHGVNAYSDKDAPGVYVDGKKIASLGLRVRHGYCYHGMAINVDMDITPFQAINPCGYQGLQIVQVSDLVSEITVDDIIDFLVSYFHKKLHYDTIRL